MEELNQLFAQAQAGDLDSYGRIVRRFQNMAVGYAYSILGDFQLAEDASQEAFIETYLHFNKLYGPAVFPAWLRRTVFKHCDRMTRRRQVATIPLEEAPQLSSHEPAPDEVAAGRETKDGVNRATQSLPESERAVTALFYIGGYSQSEIGAFLEIPTKTVKSRLHATRYRMIVEGLRAIKAVNYPAFIDLNLRNFYISEQQWDGDYPANPAQGLKEKLREKPFAQFTLDEVTQFLLNLSVAVRKEGDGVLAELVGLVDDELLEQGLEVMQMFGGSIVPGLVQRMLEIRTRTLLHRHETHYQMIAEGFRSIQNGENPRVIVQKLKNFYE